MYNLREIACWILIACGLIHGWSAINGKSLLDRKLNHWLSISAAIAALYMMALKFNLLEGMEEDNEA